MEDINARIMELEGIWKQKKETLDNLQIQIQNLTQELLSIRGGVLELKRLQELEKKELELNIPPTVEK
jgi:hypothetical protein